MTAGWHSDLPTFHATAAGSIRGSLQDFVRDYSPEQDRAWRDSIPLLQREAGELLDARATARGYGAVLEYQLPYDGRRPDVIVLAEGAVVVLELKGKQEPSLADVDQAAGYARDLRAYHRECHTRPVTAIVVPTRAKGTVSRRGDVLVVAPDRLDEVVGQLAGEAASSGPELAAFLDHAAYCPLPTLVQAARELFHSGTVREIWSARSKTEPAVQAIADIAHEAAATRTRHLVLVTGVPGAGKTLVGMRAVHAHHLDDLAVPREGSKPTVPGLYLTGNGPLAEVLQYELKKAGGGGATFVRHISWYLDRYVPHPDRKPAEHLLVFDEAQRAFSADMVSDKHKSWPHAVIASEPELFVRLCDRMPQWSVLVGLIGTGQEIHLGEEDGMTPWRDAVLASQENWTVHAPASLESCFTGTALPTRWNAALNLDTEIRFHKATRIHDFVDDVLARGDSRSALRVAEEVIAPGKGMRLYLTRDLDAGKAYLQERYAEAPDARFGILASSRDKSLPAFGIHNDFMSTKNVNKGAWFAEDGSHEKSCRQLNSVMTEFGCQGLELEMALLAWGTDLIRKDGVWSDERARRYGNRGRVRPVNPFQLRLNAYRVLLTRGRDGTLVFVPPLPELDETWSYLRAAGFQDLGA